MTKFIFVTGGVVSSLGKGIASRVSRRNSRIPRHQGHPPQARSLHQRRSRDHESFPARRGVRDRGWRRDRPRPRALRALRRRQDDEAQQLHHRPDLRERDQEGAPRRLPRRHGAGDPAHHRRDQEFHSHGRGRGRSGDLRNRRHGGRHRIPAFPRSRPPDEHPERPRQFLLHPPDAGAVHSVGRRDQDQADAALGEGIARNRHPARHPAVPRRPHGAGQRTPQDRAVHQRRGRSGDLGGGRRFHLQDPRFPARAGARRNRLPQARHHRAAGRPVEVGKAAGRAPASRPTRRTSRWSASTSTSPIPTNHCRKR